MSDMDNSEEEQQLHEESMPILIPAHLANILRQSLGLQFITVDDDDDDDDDEDYVDQDPNEDDDGESENWETTSESIAEDPTPMETSLSPPPPSTPPSSILTILRERELNHIKNATEQLYNRFLPTGKPTIKDRFPSKPYCGQYSHDGSTFYSATQDFKIHLYNCLDGFQRTNTINAMPGSWTITDCDLSRNNRDLIYSSIHDTVYMVNLDSISHDFNDHVPLTFSDNEDFGIWSIRLSNDSKEIIAGSNGGQIFVYDVEQKKRLHKIKGHNDDVNAVCFADNSSNVVVSGSDDSFLKIWDRRSLRNDSKPSGVLIGHTEGITFVSSKRDGRSLLSNGKDQRMMMWDMRKLLNPSPDTLRRSYSKNFDYRWESYPGPPRNHPQNVSIRSFTGHKVLRTLIRCHFSPDATGHRFAYTGSSDGRVHVFDTESGETVEVLEPPKVKDRVEEDDVFSAFLRRRRGGDGACARDVAWNPGMPSIVASTWVQERGLLLQYSFRK